MIDKGSSTEVQNPIYEGNVRIGPHNHAEFSDGNLTVIYMLYLSSSRVEDLRVIS